MERQVKKLKEKRRKGKKDKNKRTKKYIIKRRNGRNVQIEKK